MIIAIIIAGVTAGILSGIVGTSMSGPVFWFVFIVLSLIMIPIITALDGLFSGRSSNYNDYSVHGDTHNYTENSLYDQRSVHFHEDKSHVEHDKIDSK